MLVPVVLWSFAFPTAAEQVLWRITILYTVGLGPLVAGLCVVLVSGFGSDSYSRSPVVTLSMMVYFVARLVILVEMFRTKSFLPPDAFVST